MIAFVESEAHSAVRQRVDRRPHAVAWHIQTLSQRLPPRRRRERLAPVICHADCLSVLQFGNRNVPIYSAVSVIAAPLDDEDVATGAPPPDAEPQSFEVGLYLGDARPASNKLATLRPLAHHILRQWYTKNAFKAGLVDSFFPNVKQNHSEPPATISSCYSTSNATLKTIPRVLSEHHAFAVQTACAGRRRRSLFNNLRRAGAVVAAYCELVPALLKGPVIAPNHPRQARQWRPQLRFAP